MSAQLHPPEDGSPVPTNADLLEPVVPGSAQRLRFDRWRLADLDPVEASVRWHELGRLAAAVATPSLHAGTGWVADIWPSRRADADRSAVLTARWGATLVGFMLVRELSVGPTRVLHLKSAYVHPGMQRRGVAFALNARMVFAELARHPVGSRWVVADVINPVSFAGWRARLSGPAASFPDVGDGTPRPALCEIAPALAGELYPGLLFDPTTGVIAGLTGPRPDPATRSGDAAVDAHFERHVDASSGDALLMVLDGRRTEVLRGLGRIPGAVLRSAIATRRRTA